MDGLVRWICSTERARVKAKKPPGPRSPGRRGKSMPRKIIALKFDDGTELKIRGISDVRMLAQHLASLLLQDDLRKLAANLKINWPHIARQHEQRQALKLEKRAKKRADASRPRKPVTNDRLVDFRSKYEQDEGKKHGWKKAACIKFGIDLKTLNRRIRPEDAEQENAGIASPIPANATSGD